jgi:LPXTG-motif cell wall-anchored protein
VYEWSTFDTLNNAEVTVNSVPQQVMVSKNGSYSFNLDKGSYSIVARWGGNATDALYARENVTITQDGGDYVIDLILFPSGDFSDIGFFDENVTPIVTEEPVDVPTAQPQQPPNTGAILILAIVIIILVAGVGAFLLMRRKKLPLVPEKATEQAAQQPEEPVLPPLPPSASVDVTLPDDLREVIRIIERNGGRITQLDLRKALPCSEAKVSLMVTDLESRGIVKKIKKGRGNVIILNKPSDDSG